MALAALVEKLRRAYTAAGLDCGKSLLPPAPAVSLARAEKGLGLHLPAALRELYAVHGGQRYGPPGVTGLFGRHRLYTPANLVRQYRMLCENCLNEPVPEFPPAANERGYFHPRLLPFAGWDAYDLCVDVRTGRVWDFEPYSGLLMQGRYPSIAAALRRLLALVKKGEEPVL